jgi:UDP-N-acetylenolpyruvoylglucosamine reductase
MSRVERHTAEEAAKKGRRSHKRTESQGQDQILDRPVEKVDYAIEDMLQADAGFAVDTGNNAEGYRMGRAARNAEVNRAKDSKKPDKVYTLNNDKCHFSYRHSLFQNKDLIVLRVKFVLKKEQKSLIQQRISSTIAKKISTQPLNLPSAGSVFKHSNVIPAKVIDELNLKGLIVGKAQISKKHAGFIVNLGGATCQDVKGLISIINYKVLDAYNTTLIPEIEIFD